VEDKTKYYDYQTKKARNKIQETNKEEEITKSKS
jgi:hypothetical protein